MISDCLCIALPACLRPVHVKQLFLWTGYQYVNHHDRQTTH